MKCIIMGNVMNGITLAVFVPQLEDCKNCVFCCTVCNICTVSHCHNTLCITTHIKLDHAGILIYILCYYMI